MIIEKQLEKQIIDALKSDCQIPVYFSGAWDSAGVGEVRGDEGDAKTVCAVTVSPRSMPEYGNVVRAVVADLNVQIDVAQVVEDDAQGVKVLELWEVFAPVVWSWVKGTRVGGLNELTIESGEGKPSFHPGGVQQTGGTAPAYDSQRGMWTFSISFTVRGIVRD